MEAGSSSKRCVRLRRAICNAINSLAEPLCLALDSLRKHAVMRDLEKYYEIYEIGSGGIEDDPNLALAMNQKLQSSDSLFDITIGIEKLHTMRKMLLCTLLALDAEGGRKEHSTWSNAVEVMLSVSSVSDRRTSDLHQALGNEGGGFFFGALLGYSVDANEADAPSESDTNQSAEDEKGVKSESKALWHLSQSVRRIQAKIQLLCDEYDSVSNQPKAIVESGDKLAAHYDSIGTALKEVHQEWEFSKGIWMAGPQEPRHSRPVSKRLSIPLSPTSSLGGTTAVEGSPQAALHALDGDRRSISRSSVASSTSDEQIFEAVANPPPRSKMSREERIAKMREDRNRQAIVKEKAQANTHLLRELETVIKFRPRGRTTGRVTSV